MAEEINPYIRAITAAQDAYRMSSYTPAPDVVSDTERMSRAIKQELDELTARAEHWDYIQELKTQAVIPLRLPAHTISIARQLREAAQYAPASSQVKLRVRNQSEPFNKPKLQLETLSVTDSVTTILGRYERDVSEKFTHEALHTTREFSYMLDKGVGTIKPWTVLGLPAIKYAGHVAQVKYVHEYRRIMETNEVFLRDPGLYLFIPYNELDHEGFSNPLYRQKIRTKAKQRSHRYLSKRQNRRYS